MELSKHNRKGRYISSFVSLSFKFRSLIQTLKNLGSLGPIMLFTIVGPGIGALVLATTSDHWLSPLQELGSLNYLIFFICTVLLTGLSLIPTHATSLIAGILFGSWLGPTLALVSVVTAALFGYSIMSKLISPKALESLLQNPKAKKIHHELFQHSKQKTSIIIALLRLSPLMPFAASNLVFSTTKTPLLAFTLGSAIGLAPRVIAVALAGVGLSHLDMSQSKDQTIAIFGGIATIVAIAVITRIVQKIIKE